MSDKAFSLYQGDIIPYSRLEFCLMFCCFKLELTNIVKLDNCIIIGWILYRIIHLPALVPIYTLYAVVVMLVIDVLLNYLPKHGVDGVKFVQFHIL